MNPKARQAKSKARLSSYENLLKEATPDKISEMQIYIPPGPRLGEIVIEAKDVRKAFGSKILFDNVNFTIPRGSIVGVIGPDGVGKSTLFKMIIGAREARLRPL